MKKLFIFLLVLWCFPAFGQHAIVSGYFHNLSSIATHIVSTLPTCNAAQNGVVRQVTDALTPAVASTVVGLGAIHTLVHCNGTNWIVG
jgi:hypothetical protein